MGYKADADLWCPECALREYGKPPDRAEREIFPGTPDREGNEMFPVFAGAEFDWEPVCGRCGEKLEGCTVTGAP